MSETRKVNLPGRLGNPDETLGTGVPATSRTVNGTSHAGDVIFRAAVPEVYAASARDLVGFAGSL